MSLLAAPTSKPNVALRPSADVISSIGPLLNLAVWFQQILSSATLLLFFRTYLAARVIGAALLFGSRIAALNTLFACRLLAVRSGAMTKQCLTALWDSQRSKRLRKKLEYEFFVLILGPMGNLVCLALFWPGWVVLGAMGWALWPGAS
ncbi:hypothetical protein B0T16DRAFT_461988 [Cercophora newfieldiana]|uniref:Uncharacterized protein n=1 Tax=Cercophora newfieldiana TaxID=92897 RepID=A0AA39XYP0_9PEZI|nr:hypothetical protein B0T16DRAFT_461988 [Cercophora newfieldiana]